MKNNRFIHYAFVLGLIASISAGILAVVNKETISVIETNQMAVVNQSRKLVLTSAETFDTEKTVKVDGMEFIPGMDENGEIVGYVVTVSEPGYVTDIDFVLGIENKGVVSGLKIINSQETPGLGSKIMDEEWQKKAMGKDETYTFNKSTDGFAGATISPNAVYSGIKKALTSFKNGVKK